MLRLATCWLCILMLPGVALADSIESGAAPVVVIEGAEFPNSRQVDDTPLQLHAASLLRYLFINGYAAALYLRDGTKPAQVLGDVPKRLELHYFRSIPAGLFGTAAQSMIERNVAPSAVATLQAEIDRLAAWYVDVEPGDRYALSYLPGTGTMLEHNGERLGTIPGAEFAAAYFSIWLGEEPIDADLRDQLLRTP